VGWVYMQWMRRFVLLFFVCWEGCWRFVLDLDDINYVFLLSTSLCLIKHAILHYKRTQHTFLLRSYAYMHIHVKREFQAYLHATNTSGN